MQAGFCRVQKLIKWANLHNLLKWISTLTLQKTQKFQSKYFSYTYSLTCLKKIPKNKKNTIVFFETLKQFCKVDFCLFDPISYLFLYWKVKWALGLVGTCPPPPDLSSAGPVCHPWPPNTQHLLMQIDGNLTTVNSGVRTSGNLWHDTNLLHTLRPQ